MRLPVRDRPTEDSPRNAGRRRRVRRLPDGSEVGDTLVELLAALAIIGITVVAILGGFATAISASAQHRTVAELDSILKSYVEKVTQQLQNTSASPTFKVCAQVSDYSSITLSETLSGQPYTASLNSAVPIQYWQTGGGWSTTCSTSGEPQSQLLQAVATNINTNASATMQFVVSDSSFAPAAVAAPTFASSSVSQSVTAGNPASFVVGANGFPAPALTASNLPSWGNLVDNGSGNGTLFFNPPASAASTTPYSITLTANNGVTPAPSNTQTFNLTVSSPPSITSKSNATVALGGSFTVAASGTPTPTLSASGLPAGVTFTAATGKLNVASTATPGVYTGATGITFAANSAGGTFTQAFSLVIGATPVAPVFTSSTTDELTPHVAMPKLIVAAYGSPQPTITCVAPCSLPAGLSFTQGTGEGQVTGTPTTPGTYPAVTFKATSGLSTQTLAVQFTVDPVSTPSISGTNPAPATATHGTSFSFFVFGSGFQNGGTVQSSGMTATEFFINSTEVELAGTAGGSTGNFSFTIKNADSGSATSSSSAFQVS